MTCTVCYRDYEHAHDRRKWIGVDFDHTLALDIDNRDDPYVVGAPIMPMVRRVQGWLAEGYTVKILTARMCATSYTAGGVARDIKMMEHILRRWCLTFIGQELECTAAKDGLMEVLWDDRAVQVVRDLGHPMNTHGAKL